MASRLTNIFFIAFFLTSFSTFAQQKSFTPTRGEIVFSSSAIILDTAYFTNSLKENNKRLIKHLIKELAIDTSEKIDTINLLSLVNGNITPKSFSENSDFRFLYKDAIIESHKILNNKRSNSFSIIDTKHTNYSDVTVLGDDTNAVDPIDFRYLKMKDKNIREFRNEKRLINGYECFKVTFNYKVAFSEDEGFLAMISNNEQCSATYWVTEKIKSLFHPISKEKEILEKYYPLEITYENPLHKGLILQYKLKSINLSD
ncbi:MAG: hypothetical protein REI64_02560 [Pedobacter sp.]|uniref:hypothetical protein n=1 Tax=Pedobacter sp. TaxID=1411316 RepID=UPI0028079197|nr:hypothetical protein [Pedobacter sp.]MDQ8003651.1 hypothetical protein [Pedobacter sp.]